MTLNSIDFASLGPLLFLLFGALVILLVESFSDLAAKRFSFFIALLTILLAIYSALISPASQSPLLTPWLRFDFLARFFTIFFLLIGFATILLSPTLFKNFAATSGEYYFLLLSGIFGLILIGSSADFLTLFLGLETLSISLYVLCGYIKIWEISNESSFKYFLMGALATAFTLYGIALIYGATGTTKFDLLIQSYQNSTLPSTKSLFFAGTALVTLGFAFKAAIVPFHVWAPDVYAGAPTPITAFMAVGTKAGAFAAFSIVFLISLSQFDTVWNQLIAWLAYPTLIYANYLALRQTQLRRFFAYSGISHAGFLLIPLAAGTPDAISSILFYLIIYAFATFGSFAILTFLDKSSEGVTFDNLKGLFYRSPFLSGVLILCLLTLAGIPPTAGFFAKFYIFMIAFKAGYYGLVIVGLLTTILSAYYYLRIIGLLFSQQDENQNELTQDLSAGFVAAISSLAILFLSFYPGPLLDLLIQNYTK